MFPVVMVRNARNVKQMQEFQSDVVASETQSMDFFLRAEVDVSAAPLRHHYLLALTGHCTIGTGSEAACDGGGVGDELAAARYFLAAGPA